MTQPATNRIAHHQQRTTPPSVALPRPSGEPTHVSHHVADFLVDVLHDAWIQGDRAHWLKRAEQFARVGTPNADEIARACRNRADFTDAASQQFQETLLAFLHQANTD